MNDFAIAASHQHLITQLCGDLEESFVIVNQTRQYNFLGIRIHLAKRNIFIPAPPTDEEIAFNINKGKQQATLNG